MISPLPRLNVAFKYYTEHVKKTKKKKKKKENKVYSVLPKASFFSQAQRLFTEIPYFYTRLDSPFQEEWTTSTMSMLPRDQFASDAV